MTTEEALAVLRDSKARQTDRINATRALERALKNHRQVTTETIKHNTKLTNDLRLQTARANQMCDRAEDLSIAFHQLAGELTAAANACLRMARGEGKKGMGYSAKCIDAEFDIEPEKRPAAFAALKALAEGGRRKHDWGDDWGHTDIREVLGAEDLFEAIRAFGWECPFLLEGGPDDPYLQAVSYLGEKLSYSDPLLFNTIAPFVKAGSYIEMSGEDGARWRYVFDGKKMEQVSPKISW